MKLPGTRYSYRGGLQETFCLTRLEGREKGVVGLLEISFFMTVAQIGLAPVIPDATELMGELSLLPTQTETR